ncbi:MAG: hypothetical protein M3R66_03935 [Actinomycetota bacterium]|nr:hypothetical protein [Geodermatophilaceae bacterium]MDQ3052989.1 hypothetical protein [Actinomycetota bacterium]
MIRRLLGVVLVLVLAAVCAVLEVFYLPLRAGPVLLPLSVAAAVAGNVAFTRAMYEIAGSVWLALLPGAVWLGVIGRSAIARPEGDLLISDGGSSTATAVVNLAFLLLGSLALAFTVGTLRRPQRTRAVGQPPETAGIT